MRRVLILAPCPASAQRIYAEPRSGSTFQRRDAQRRTKRGAEAPGRRTPLRRLLRGVGRPILPVKPLAPITRAPLLVRNGDDVKNSILDEVDERIRKCWKYIAPCVSNVLRPPIRRLDNDRNRMIEFDEKCRFRG